ncbi:tetratricopeptide repeat protein [Desulfomarina sp.]
MKADFTQSCQTEYSLGMASSVKFFTSAVFFLILFFFPLNSNVAAEIAPTRTITVVAESPDVPGWKKIWDNAREKVKADDYDSAVILYKKLHNLKPNIEEANWEYFKVLMNKGLIKEATRIINSLLEKNPSKNEYLLGSGRIFLSEKKYNSALKQFGRVYEFDPDGSFSVNALGGMIVSLEGEKKKNVLLPLLEQLHLRQNTDTSIVQKLIETAAALGKNDKALHYFSLLRQNRQLKHIDSKILFLVAGVLEKKGDRREASQLWEEYLRRTGDYFPFHKKLVAYYLDGGKRESALPHLIRLSRRSHADDALLKQIAEIYLHTTGRPDKALTYLEKYLAKHPEDRKIKKKIKNIQAILANDFLAIVENDGAWLLWRDLAQITPNRLAIYREMATLLEKKGKKDELFEVLKIISHHNPEDSGTIYKIISICREKKNYPLALKYLEKLPESAKNTKKFFLLKGDLEFMSGREISSLISYANGLKKDEKDLKLRQTCIRLAGRLGFVDKVNFLFEGTPDPQEKNKNFSFIFNYLEQLRYNFFFSSLDTALGKYYKLFASNPQHILKLRLLQAQSLRARGNRAKAEELLRLIVAEEGPVPEVFFDLAVTSAEVRNISAARVWKEGFVQFFPADPKIREKRKFERKKNYLEGIISLAEGDVEQTVAKTVNLENLRLKKKEGLFLSDLEYKLKKKLCWLLLEDGNIDGSKELLKELLKIKEFDPERVVLRHVMETLSGAEAKAGPEKDSLYINRQPVLSRFIQVALTALHHNEFDFGRQILKTVLKNMPESIVGMNLLAEFSYYSGKMKEPVTIFKKIVKRYPSEKYFIKKLVMSEGKLERYQQGLSVLVEHNTNLTELLANRSFPLPAVDFEEILLFARMQWGAGNRNESLKLYEFLLNPPVVDILEKRFEFEEIYYLYLTKEKSFWNSLKFLLQTKPEIVAELMQPPFLIDNLKNETGKIIAEYYSLYTWQKMIENEYLARKAIVRRDYETAERNYKRMLEDAGSREGLYDLASIYDRRGQYRKEAQVYEAIRSSGTTSERLESSIESNSLKISPHTGLSVNLVSRKGRGGYMNLEKRGVGFSLMFTPDLQKDIKFEFSRNIYEEVTGPDSLTSSFLESTGTVELTGNTDFIFSAAAERLSDDAETKFYYSVGLHSQLDDFFTGFIEGYRKKIDDTLLAIKDSMYSEGLEIGLSAETPLGLNLGVSYRHRYYSDGNSQNGFHGWSSYNLYGESILWALRYDYEFLKNNSCNDCSDAEGDGEIEEKTYWKPDTFDEHRITLHFKHLVSGNYGSDRLLSYYIFDNSVGYEDNENAIYIGKFDIFLEMSHHYLLKGNFVFQKNSDFEEKTVLFSLFYRW